MTRKTIPKLSLTAAVILLYVRPNTPLNLPVNFSVDFLSSPPPDDDDV
jgi:hypothetical protein